MPFIAAFWKVVAPSPDETPRLKKRGVGAFATGPCNETKQLADVG